MHSETSARFGAPKVLTMICFFETFGLQVAPGRTPKIDEKRDRGGKSASGDGAGTDFLRFLAPLSFGVGLGIDF